MKSDDIVRDIATGELGVLRRPLSATSWSVWFPRLMRCVAWPTRLLHIAHDIHDEFHAAVMAARMTGKLPK